MLHKIAQSMEKAGKPLPELEILTVHLFGKVGEGHGCEWLCSGVNVC